jgi:hypothetical protein
MAFSLKIATPNDTITFSNSTSPTFTGYRVLSYMPGNTEGGSAPAVDTIVCEIVGSGTTAAAMMNDAHDKLRKLRRAIYWADADNMGQNTSGPAYLEFQPVTASNASWAVVSGGRVTEPAPDLNLTKGIITGVTIALQREPFWRGYQPQYNSSLSTFSTDGYSASVTARGSQSITSVPGDLPALVYLALGQASAGGSTTRAARVAYVSQRNNPNNYNVWGVFAGPSNLSSFSASVADASAENGANAARIAGTVSSYSPVVYTFLNQSGGACRVFARMRLSAAGDWSAYAFKRSGVSPDTSPLPTNGGGVTVSVTSTTYAVYDLGVIGMQDYLPSFNAYTGGSALPGNGYVGISGLTNSGAGLLTIDWMYLMPVHESYIECTDAINDTRNLVYDNMNPEPRNANGVYNMNTTQPQTILAAQRPRGVMRIPPGNGYFYWLIVNNTGSNPTHVLKLRYCPLWSAPKGTGG